MSQPILTITSLALNDGTTLELPGQGLVVVVGPNNAGKSLLLRELHSWLSSPFHPLTPPRVLKDLQVHKGGGDELRAWLDTKTEHSDPRGGETEMSYRRLGNRATYSILQNAWLQPWPHLSTLAGYMVAFLNAEGRTQMVQSAGMYDVMNDEPQQPLQVLYAREDLEQLLCDTAEEAFGTSLFVNRYAGNQVHLQIGTAPASRQVPPSPDTLSYVKSCPHVHEQGDGMKSLLGIMLTLTAANYPIVIIDEPEAYLHPPQARTLGRRLSRLAPDGTQVFIATHSSDIVEGVLEDPSVPITVLRITRLDELNPVAALNNDSIRELWGDPLLKFSGALDGLFHSAVCICESDSDATFYSAALAHDLAERRLPASDIQFVQSGGKDRMNVVIRAMRAVNVPVRAIAVAGDAVCTWVGGAR